ncbi:MAG: hypothetical protein ABJB93_01385 [Gaiellales bacterium]
MRRFKMPEGWRRRPDLDRFRDRELRRPQRPRWLHGPDLDELRDREWRRPRWLVVPTFGRFRMADLDVPKHLLLPGATVILLLFGGGLYFGNMLGSDPSAASLITTVTSTGKIVTLSKSVVLPAKTVTRNGKTVKLPRRTVNRTRTQTQTQIQTETQTRQHTVIVPVPTTITRTTTVRSPPTTITVTVTVPTT